MEIGGRTSRMAGPAATFLAINVLAVVPLRTFYLGHNAQCEIFKGARIQL
jgi:hypothetical protein